MRKPYFKLLTDDFCRAERVRKKKWFPHLVCKYLGYLGVAKLGKCGKSAEG